MTFLASLRIYGIASRNFINTSMVCTVHVSGVNDVSAADQRSHASRTRRRSTRRRASKSQGRPSSRVNVSVSLDFMSFSADLRKAQPCWFCFYSVVQKWVFRSAGVTRFLDKREIWHGWADQIWRLLGQKCGNRARKLLNFEFWP